MGNDKKPFKFSSEFAVRILGAFAFSFIFIAIGLRIGPQVSSQPILVTLTVFALLGFIAGLVLTPLFTTRPMERARILLLSMPPERLTAVIFGLLLGLLAGGLFSIPLSFLPSPFREILPLASVVVFSYLSAVILSLRQNDLKALFNSFQRITNPQPTKDEPPAATADIFDRDMILLDTSVIIDGRITDISRTGFLRGSLIIPSFILRELQHIADSTDAVRRNRGRRGLEVLSILQNEAPVPVRITDIDAPDLRDADSKLVAVAKQMHSPIMTNDYNLNRVAELQGVNVMNINDLANAVKVAYLPGEELQVKIIQEGREIGQGVGYLDDGTMVVIEDGQYRMNDYVDVMVTKVLQTSAGRMIFGRFLTQAELAARRG
ncbi:MAG: TRAM domain-containing protein [Ardenticatenaceae bacterium]|nr:TRAM domain-containing protein [Ardenticatenaceae bacterium]